MPKLPKPQDLMPTRPLPPVLGVIHRLEVIYEVDSETDEVTAIAVCKCGRRRVVNQMVLAGLHHPAKGGKRP